MATSPSRDNCLSICLSILLGKRRTSRSPKGKRNVIRAVRGNYLLRVETSIDLSPDGRLILFNGNGGGGSDLFIFDLETRQATRLTDTPEQEIHPRFSPDGSQIVYSSGAPDFDTNYLLFPRHLYIRNLSTGEVTQITSEKTRWDYSPAFSSDGKYVVFDGATPESPALYTGDVYIVDVAGPHPGSCRRLTHEYYNMMLRPRFWQDDSAVLFSAYKNSEDKLGAYLASVAVTKEHQKPVPVTPLGATTHSGP